MRGRGWGPSRCGCCLRRWPGSSRRPGRRGRGGGGCGWCRWTARRWMPRMSEANWERFGGPSTKTADGKRLRGAFPQVRLLALAECGTRALVAAVHGGYATGEKTLARDLLGRLGEGMLCLADRNFACWELWRDAAATGAQLLWRIGASFSLPVDEVLADGTYLSRLKAPRKLRKDGARGHHRAGHRVPARGRARERHRDVHPDHHAAGPGAGAGPRAGGAVPGQVGDRDRAGLAEDPGERRRGGAAVQDPRRRHPGGLGAAVRLPCRPRT